MESSSPPVKIGEILKQCGLIEEAQLQEALNYAAQEKLRLGEALMELGILDEDRLTWALGVQFDLSYVDLQPGMIEWSLLDEVPLSRLLENNIVPMSRANNTVTAVIADPTRPGLGDLFHELFPHDEVVVQLASEDSIEAVLHEAERRAAESKRQQPSPRPEASATAEDLLALLDLGRANDMVIFKTSAQEYGQLISSGEDSGVSRKLSPAAVDRLSARLAEECLQEFSLPGGLAGFRPAQESLGRAAIRVLILSGINGWVAALERFSLAVPETENHPVFLLCGPSPVTIKAQLFALAAELMEERDSEVPPVSLEYYIPFIGKGIFQAEIPDGRKRAAAARRLLSAARPSILFVEAGDASELTAFNAVPRILTAGPLFVIANFRRFPDLEELPMGMEKVELPEGPDEIRPLLLEMMSKDKAL